MNTRLDQNPANVTAHENEGADAELRRRMADLAGEIVQMSGVEYLSPEDLENRDGNETDFFDGLATLPGSPRLSRLTDYVGLGYPALPAAQWVGRYFLSSSNIIPFLEKSENPNPETGEHETVNLYEDRLAPSPKQLSQGDQGDLESALVRLRPGNFINEIGFGYTFYLRSHVMPDQEVETLCALGGGEKKTAVPKWTIRVGVKNERSPNKNRLDEISDEMIAQPKEYRVDEVTGEEGSAKQPVIDPDIYKGLIKDPELKSPIVELNYSENGSFQELLRENFVDNRDDLMSIVDLPSIGVVLPDTEDDQDSAKNDDDRKDHWAKTGHSPEEIDELYKAKHAELFSEFCDDLIGNSSGKDQDGHANLLRYVKGEGSRQLKFTELGLSDQDTSTALEFVPSEAVKSAIYLADEFDLIGYKRLNNYEINGFCAVINKKWLITVVPSSIEVSNQLFNWVNVFPLSEEMSEYLTGEGRMEDFIKVFNGASRAQGDHNGR